MKENKKIFRIKKGMVPNQKKESKNLRDKKDMNIFRFEHMI